MKHFVAILLLTLLVWGGVSMSEEKEYPIRVHVEATGYDTVRYALLHADTILDLVARLSGYNALLYSLQPNEPRLQVPVPRNATAVPVTNLLSPLQHKVRGVKQIKSDIDSLSFILAERAHRVYRPNLTHVHFTFGEQYGLYGQPRLIPSEVTLYGPQEALDQINDICVQPAQLCNITESDTFLLTLDPVWQRFPDVHTSASQIRLFLPVEPYVEKAIEVPIQVIGADTTVSLKLYPQQATVNVWVAQRDLYREPQLVVAVDYQKLLANGGRTQPQLCSFPDYIRPRSIQPEVVQCVIIK